MAPARRPLGRTLAARALLVLAFLAAASPLALGGAAAQGELRDPREIVTSYDEAGKAAYIVKDEAGTDDNGRWAHRKWFRDRDNEDDRHVGPVVTASTVWVTKDVETAKRVFARQTELNKQFPEREDYARGPFDWAFKGDGPQPKDFAQEWSAASACVQNACDTKGAIDTHRRVVIRKENIVGAVYIFGRDEVATPELAVWFAKKLAERMPPYPEPDPTPEEG